MTLLGINPEIKMENDILYSVAIERAKGIHWITRKPLWDIGISYLHAKDQTEAAFKYRAGNTQELMNYELFKSTGKATYPMRKVIAIAPVVFVLKDEETGQVTTDVLDAG